MSLPLCRAHVLVGLRRSNPIAASPLPRDGARVLGRMTDARGWVSDFALRLVAAAGVLELYEVGSASSPASKISLVIALLLLLYNLRNLIELKCLWILCSMWVLTTCINF